MGETHEQGIFQGEVLARLSAIEKTQVETRSETRGAIHGIRTDLQVMRNEVGELRRENAVMGERFGRLEACETGVEELRGQIATARGAGLGIKGLFAVICAAIGAIGTWMKMRGQ